jgi:hypothetical protein
MKSMPIGSEPKKKTKKNKNKYAGVRILPLPQFTTKGTHHGDFI